VQLLALFSDDAHMEAHGIRLLGRTGLAPSVRNHGATGVMQMDEDEIVRFRGAPFAAAH
jgi:hypothetical protein